MSGIERDLATFSQALPNGNNFRSLFWLDHFPRELIWCCQLADILWLHCCDFRMVTLLFPQVLTCSIVQNIAARLPQRRKTQYYARVEGEDFLGCECSESRDLGGGVEGGGAASGGWGGGEGRYLTVIHTDFEPILSILAFYHLLCPLLVGSIPESFKVWDTNLLTLSRFFPSILSGTKK